MGMRGGIRSVFTVRKGRNYNLLVYTKLGSLFERGALIRVPRVPRSLL
jgi:hypothetical protein